ncbi:hypothetical protein [Sphingomonas endolithica]|uniref:hypothetical protein n=1 Tax=Sphingomonas endolithica TaxID=2972485 RepID=UPI0021AFB59A|nr:hypothetical protein [Sphingomonas sp. ZFBP2030]
MIADVPRLAINHLGLAAGDNGYGGALTAVFDTAPPAYASNLFAREFQRQAKDPSWFASLLVSDCDLEGYSARQLSRYSGEVVDRRVAMGLAAHAADEARHSRMFASLVVEVFPNLRPDIGLRDKLREMAPRLRLSSYGGSLAFAAVDEALLSSMVLINLHEVKALILEYLLRPLALAHAPAAHRSKVGRQLDVLVADEVQHIRYSAAYINHAVTNGWGNTVMDMMRDYGQLMDDVTLDEIEQRSPHALAEELEL